MQLTRRDAVVALSSLGVGSYVAGQFGSEDGQLNIETIIAVAEVVSPSEVEIGREFVETFVLGRVHASEHYHERVRQAVATLEGSAQWEHGKSFAALPPADRLEVLTSLGVNRAHSVPDGTTAQRIRYYLINELLYAVYTSPVGGDLLDHENPPGYPGGRTAYREGPDR